MYEKEEKELKDFRTHLEQVPLPLDAADGAIMQGLERGKREKQQTITKQKRTLWTLAAAALLILTLATTIRASPAFADVVASIPGMEGFVELIQQDKGLHAVFENDYYQLIGESQTIGSATMTIDGVILDESGMNIFYTITSAQEIDALQINAPVLDSRQEIPNASISYDIPTLEEDAQKTYSDLLRFHFAEPVQFTDLNFTLDLTVTLNGQESDFSVPFTVPENVKPSVRFALDKEVEVEGQKFTVEEVTIHPLRVGVRISSDPHNTKKILQFEDLRLEDENGEIWGSIMNGTSSFGENEEGDAVYFLQSNYFETPEELYLRINKMQAIDKEDAYLVVDTEKDSLIHSPEDGNLELISSSRSKFEITMQNPPEEEFNRNLGAELTDANGEEVDVASMGMIFKEDNLRSWIIDIQNDDYANPIKMELLAYPDFIEGDVKIELTK